MTTVRSGADEITYGTPREHAMSLLAAEPVAQLAEQTCRTWLGASIPFGPAVQALDTDAAVAAGRSIGFPVVCKLLSPDLLHKSDLGMVKLSIGDEATLRTAAEELLTRGRELGLSAPSLSVQKHLSGIEVAVGLYRDPLGPVCLVAAGGTLIEVIDDTAHSMAPVTVAQAKAMLGGLKIRTLLAGYRGQAGGAVDALAELISRVSELAVAVPEIAELDLNPVFVTGEGVFAADARATLRPVPESDPLPLYDGVVDLVRARRIALIGGSSARLKVGGLLARYLRKHGFDGDLVTVNPKGTPVEGTRVVRELGEVTEQIDLACIAVPSRAVAQAVRDCVAAGIPHGIIYSAGFAEAGPEGRAAQEELVRLAGGRFRFVGPNSMGIAALHRDFLASFGMALEAESLARGPVAFISQSGSIASSLFSRADELGVGFSHWISVGNEADLGIEDFIAYAVDDDRCQVICLFLEIIRRPAAFAEAARQARAAGKPIVVFKTGRTEEGRLATASHTGALASSDVNYSSFLNRHGVVRVDNLEDLFTAARAVQMIGGVSGNRIGVVSMSGGACSMLSDSCGAYGLQVPELSAKLQSELADALPEYASTRNPVDVTATGIQRPELVADAMRLLLRSGEVDLVLLQLGTNTDPSAAIMAEQLVAMRNQFEVPFLVGRLGSPSLAPAAMAIYAAAGMHVYSWPGQLAGAAAACVQFGRFLSSAGEAH